MEPFPRSLRWYTAGISALAAAAVAVLAWRAHSLALEATLVFGALAVVTAQRHVKLSSQVNVSPGFMVAMAAIVAAARGSLLGAVVVGALTNLRVDQFKRQSRGWMAFNVASAAVAFLAAAAAYSAWPIGVSERMPIALVAVVPAALAYLATIWTILVLSYVVEGVHSWRESLAELLPAGAEVLPFAVLGFLLGRLYLDIGPAAALLIIVPMMIAREMFASYIRVKEAHDETVQLLIRALEQKDPYTAGHAERVAVYAGYIAEELEFMPARAERLRFAALMHDIGKLVVPNQLLNKPGKLT
jgi:HD domain